MSIQTICYFDTSRSSPLLYKVVNWALGGPDHVVGSGFLGVSARLPRPVQGPMPSPQGHRLASARRHLNYTTSRR